MTTLSYPGVYIEEQTGPGVIAGVGTSTAGFIGPALRGPLLKPRRVSSFDEFLSVYAAPDKNGRLDPYIKSPQTFYLAHAVRGFFENGGQQAFIVRIGNATPAAWDAKNRNAKPETVFTAVALDAGIDGDQIKISIAESPKSLTGPDGAKVAAGTSKVSKVNAGKNLVTVEKPSVFRAGDWVTGDGTDRAQIKKITGGDLQLTAIPKGGDQSLRIADLPPDQKAIRMESTAGLFPGSVVTIKGKSTTGGDVEDSALIDAVDAAGFVTFNTNKLLARSNTFSLATATAAPALTSREFQLTVTPPAGAPEVFENLSLESVHPRFALSTVSSKLVRLQAPGTPPQAVAIPDRLAAEGDVSISQHGTAVDLGALSLDDFEDGLNALDKIDEVSLVCIPDAAARGDWQSIQNSMITHCANIKDRFAILDSRPGLAAVDPLDKVNEQRQKVQSPNGFAALYYPWLQVRDPGSAASPPLTMLIPPCGHMAGIFARTDQERGVHKAPANTDVRGVLGLEQVLSDGEQGPLNLAGINVLRIFPGSGTVIVWGARTTVDPAISDWLYVPVRRLLLMIEESIQEGIRPAVFEPNAPPLWKSLKRTISQFLTQVWRDGGLFGDTPDKAFSVRIDEGLNPPEVRARGELFIEIGVAAVRPAEFIIVRIGLQDGGGSVQEG